MPKRPNPFAEEYCPHQSKMWIKKKDVDLGVNCESRMLSVYEYTKMLMVNGSKDLNNCYTPLDPSSQFVCKNNEILRKGKNQLCLNSSGELQKAPQKFNENKPAMEFQIGGTVALKCNFCEKKITQDNCNVCMQCNDHFCSLCSVSIYEEADVKAVCLSCHHQ